MVDLMSVTEISSALKSYAADYPSLCSLVELPNPSVEGKVCHALHIGLPNDPRNPAGLILGGVHPREWGGPDIVVNFAGDLLRAYKAGKSLQYPNQTFASSDIKRLIDETTLVIFPCVNPDGVDYSHNHFALCRKNRSQQSPTGDSRTVGVDINRNFDFLWDFKKHFAAAVYTGDHHVGSTEPDIETFHGPFPFSEPETRNVKWLMDKYTGLTMCLDVHSYAGDVLYNWGDDTNQHTDSTMSFRNAGYDGYRGVLHSGYGEFLPENDEIVAKSVAEAIRDAMTAAGRPYVATPGATLYPTSGTSDDYAFSRHLATPGLGKVYGFTIEFNFKSDGTSANVDPFLVTGDPDVLDRTLAEVIPGLIAFAFQVKRIELPPLPPIDVAVRQIYVNVFTGESWFIGTDGKIHKTDPVPDPYRTIPSNDLWKIAAALDALSGVSGKTGTEMRKKLLDGVQKFAIDAAKKL